VINSSPRSHMSPNNLNTVHFCHIPLNQGYSLTLGLELIVLEMLTLTLQVGAPFNSVALITVVQFIRPHAETRRLIRLLICSRRQGSRLCFTSTQVLLSVCTYQNALKVCVKRLGSTAKGQYGFYKYGCQN
jgi:hypothetical protein